MSVRLVLVLALSAMCSSVFAQPTIVRYGNDVHVETGQTVEDVVTMGGDAQIDGDVEGDVVTMGGDVRIDGEVEGDVVTMGGDVHITGTVEGDVVSNGGSVEVHAGGQVEGQIVDYQGIAFAFNGDASPHSFDGERDEYDGYGASLINRIESVGNSFLLKAASFGVLLLIALGFHVGARNRFDAMQVAMLRQPGRSFLLGLLAKIGSLVALVVLLLTIVGIPAALVGGMAVAFASYIGLAVVASVVGAMLPVDNLRDRDNLRVAAGVATLFAVSLIPYAGPLAMFIAGAIGLGALIQTRLGSKPTPPGDGPYRTSPA